MKVFFENRTDVIKRFHFLAIGAITLQYPIRYMPIPALPLIRLAFPTAVPYFKEAVSNSSFSLTADS
jgi:hypothetical protein